MSRDESRFVDTVWETWVSLVTASIYQWNKSLKWGAGRCGRFEIRIWNEVQGDMGDLREMRHDHLGEWKNELTRGMCWGCQCFLLVRIQFPAMSILFLAVPNYLFWNNSIILAFVGLACGHFLFMAISSNVIKEVLTVFCFTYFVKYLGRKIS